MGLGEEFLDMTLKARSIKKKLKIRLQIKNFCFVKDTVKRRKSRLQTGRKYLQIAYLTEGLYPEYVKNSQNSTEKHRPQLKNRQKT